MQHNTTFYHGTWNTSRQTNVGLPHPVTTYNAALSSDGTYHVCLPQFYCPREEIPLASIIHWLVLVEEEHTVITLDIFQIDAAAI